MLQGQQDVSSHSKCLPFLAPLPRNWRVHNPRKWRADSPPKIPWLPRFMCALRALRAARHGRLRAGANARAEQGAALAAQPNPHFAPAACTCLKSRRGRGAQAAQAPPPGPDRLGAPETPRGARSAPGSPGFGGPPNPPPNPLMHASMARPGALRWGDSGRRKSSPRHYLAEAAPPPRPVASGPAAWPQAPPPRCPAFLGVPRASWRRRGSARRGVTSWGHPGGGAAASGVVGRASGRPVLKSESS